MRRRKKKKIKYKAEYEGNDLNLKLEKINFRIDLNDHLEVGVLLSKFRECGLGSRELGRLFRKSPSTVINKDRFSRIGSKSLIDGRGQRKQYKIDEIKEEILYIWAKNPMASDKDILRELQPRLSSLGMKLDLKTLVRFTKQAGIDEVRSRLRAEQAIKKDVPVSDNNNPATEVKEKEMTQTYSRYAGQMLHVPHLYQMNFAKMINGLSSPAEEDCIYSRERVCHQIYFLYAMQEERLYDLDSITHHEFGALIVMEDNLRCSGMNKRVKRMATPEAIEIFQKEALAGRSGLINRKDMELCYSDTHVIEVWPNKLIPMARHGTKNKQVKAINVHYLIGSDTGTPLSKIYSAGNKRLHWAIPQLIKRAEEGLKRKIGIVDFDKGGISIKTFKSLIKAGKAFICWGKRSEYMKRQINRLKPYRFRWRRKKEIRQDGKLVKAEERIADTTTRLKGLGKVRTVVVQLPDIEGGERLWLHTNLSRRSYSSIEIREMMGFKQRVENHFKSRKNKGALDCFAGGRCKVKAISRPSKKFLGLLRKQLKRLVKRIEKDRESLREAKNLKDHGVYEADTAKREIDYLNRRIKQNIEQKEKTEGNIKWAEGGTRPKFIKQRYELELEKQKLLNEFQDLAMLSKRESLKEFLGCYKKVLEKDNLPREEISQRMEYVDKSAIEKELFSLGGFVTCDKREKKMTIMIVPQGREYFRKALDIFLHQQNKKKIVVQYSSIEKYELHFCLAPPPPISTN